MVEVVANPECPQLAQISAEIEDLLGKRLDSLTGSLRFEVDVSVNAAAVTLTLREAGGYERSIRGNSCEAVTKAGALVIATTIDPLGVEMPGVDDGDAAEPEPETAPEPESETAPELEPETAPEPGPETASEATSIITETKRDARRPVRLFASPRFAVAAGTLPGAGLGASLGLGVQVGRGRVEVTPTGWPIRSTRADGIRTDVWAFDVSTRGCFVPRFGRLEVLACGGVALGAAQGRASGSRLEDGASRASVFWGAAVVGSGLSFEALPWLAPVLLVDAQIPFSRPEFGVSGAGVQHAFAPAAVQIALGVELRWTR